MVIMSEQSKPVLRSGILFSILLLLVVLIWIGLRIALPNRPTLFAGVPPSELGVSSGQLAPCPASPNCVSSQSKDAEHHVEPLAFSVPPEAAMASLKQVIQSQERAKIVAETDNYLYAEFTSPWMGFVDDVEFTLNEDAQVIEVRSASRLGESDLGVNRKRIETIRGQLKQYAKRLEGNSFVSLAPLSFLHTTAVVKTH